ncbi:1787_t:CDS:2 [Acaulospora colombiana]|uniref:1787_t:CDS:1 n=1 Tax=Acaulospora colombiana TaxID=27376 RepID=A0ACA9P7G4_9GLOM|nr:1787_t:CDS:2 [Acaulospora colombiana]
MQGRADLCNRSGWGKHKANSILTFAVSSVAGFEVRSQGLAEENTYGPQDLALRLLRSLSPNLLEGVQSGDVEASLVERI